MDVACNLDSLGIWLSLNTVSLLVKVLDAYTSTDKSEDKELDDNDVVRYMFMYIYINLLVIRGFTCVMIHIYVYISIGCPWFYTPPPPLPSPTFGV